MLKKFLFDEAGATAIEYTLIAGAMALVLTVTFPSLTSAISGALSTIASDISG